MNRRDLLRMVGLAPVAAAAATLGVPATAPRTGSIYLPNDMVIAARNAGVISRDSALELFGLKYEEFLKFEHDAGLRTFSRYFDKS